MRYSLLIVMVLLLSACGVRTTEVVEYERVLAAPACNSCSGLSSVTVDVSTNKIEYY